jgi:hypothetical protein
VRAQRWFNAAREECRVNDQSTARATPSSRRLLLALSAIAIGMAIVGALLFLDYSEEATGDPARVAVAPFDVMVEGRELSDARVGLARELTRAISSSGTHSAVSQAEVAQVWRSRPTPFIAAIELARKTGAGLAVYGRVDSGPADSVIVRAAMIDSYSARGLFEVQLTAAPDSLPATADSLAARLLRRLRGG